ncbi:phosphoglycerate kinase [Candidatus Kaiserbacteria bacterium]|nr:phosphoglycerate kinase [Candidatus Kaiserbacteria bacterium]
MRCIDELSAADLKGKRVLLRSDFNVPLSASGEVGDIFRLTQGWQSVKYLSERGAKVIIISHIGRDPAESLKPVAEALKKFGSVSFVADIFGDAAEGARASMRDGEILLLENLRSDSRETENDAGMGRELAAFADMYVDDAFAAAHRAHASIVSVAGFLPHYAGLLMRDEITQLDKARAPEHPSFAILGGAKFETKAPLIQALLSTYDNVFITGALANDVFKAKGYPVGRSLISKELPSKEILENPRFLAPIDATVENSGKEVKVKKPDTVEDDDKIVDIGPDSVQEIAPALSQAKFILWNGPTGLYEAGYVSYTHAIAALIAHAVEDGAQAVIGGGDTIAAILESDIPPEKLGFLSTGGGAMLEYLLKGTLPGIDALK